MIMPAAFDACVKNGGRVRTKNLGDNKYMKVCFKDGKSYAGHTKTKKEKFSWVSDFIIEDYKIDESIADDRVKIKGIALKARESRNGVLYQVEEIKKAAETLIGRSIAMNHSDNAEDVVGTVEKIEMQDDVLRYEGVAYNTGKHPYTIDMLRKGLIKHVSMETIPGKVDYVENTKVVKELEFIGLAFVRHPGIPEASTSIAEAIEK